MTDRQKLLLDRLRTLLDKSGTYKTDNFGAPYVITKHRMTDILFVVHMIEKEFSKCSK